jgi:hypothetical protein
MHLSCVNFVVRIIAPGCWIRVIDARLFVKRFASGRSCPPFTSAELAFLTQKMLSQ